MWESRSTLEHIPLAVWSHARTNDVPSLSRSVVPLSVFFFFFSSRSPRSPLRCTTGHRRHPSPSLPPRPPAHCYRRCGGGSASPYPRYRRRPRGYVGCSARRPRPNDADRIPVNRPARPRCPVDPFGRVVILLLLL